MPVHVEEVDITTGDIYRTINLTTTSSYAHPACTLGVGNVSTYWNLYADGLPANSADGTYAMFGCFNISVGKKLTMMSSKTLVRIDDHAFVTNSVPIYPFLDVYNTSGFHSLASPDGESFYLSGASADEWGWRYVSSLSARTTVFVSGLNSNPGMQDARTVGIYGGALYGISGPGDAGWAGLFQLSATLPTGQVSASLLTGMPYTLDAWTFVFQTASAVWVSVDNGAGAHGQVQLFAFSSGSWGASGSPIAFEAGSPVYSITGRTEGPVGNFILYSASPAAVYRYDTVTTAKTTIATAGSSNVIRGVVLPPLVDPPV